MKTALAKANPLVFVDHQELWTTSLTIAESFKKQHKDVLRAITKTDASDEFSRRNFAPSNYVDGRGKEQPMVRVSESGFMFVVMGFTGKDAASMKEAFIREFQRMRKALMRRSSQQLSFDWQEARKEGKIARREMTDTAKAFVEYAEAQGSSHAPMYFMNLTRNTYRALYSPCDPLGSFRDTLTSRQLRELAIAESIGERALEEAMAGELNYKDCYQLAMKKVKEYAQLVGVTVPGEEKVRALPIGRALAA